MPICQRTGRAPARWSGTGGHGHLTDQRQLRRGNAAGSAMLLGSAS